MVGHVTADKEAVVSLWVVSVSSPDLVISAVVDTGFTGFLTLPAALVAQMGLRAKEIVTAQLADGSFADLPTYVAEVEWHGEKRRVVVCGSESAPLLGMSLLMGSRLTMDAVDGGTVEIRSLAIA